MLLAVVAAWPVVVVVVLLRSITPQVMVPNNSQMDPILGPLTKHQQKVWQLHRLLLPDISMAKAQWPKSNPLQKMSWAHG